MTVHPAITDPHVRAHLARLAAQAGTIPSGATDADGDDAARIAELRANPSWVRSPDDVAVESIDLDADGLALRLYRPRAGHRGTLVFAHGGGWVAGDLDNNDALCRALATATDAQVLSVDYRLAPEHPFPAGLDDLERALRFAASGAGGLTDPSFLGVAGHSAGGNLAAALALRSREGRAPGIRVQVLLCPVLDAPDPDRPSYRAHTEDLPLTSRGMQWYWGLYLPDAAAVAGSVPAAGSMPARGRRRLRGRRRGASRLRGGMRRPRGPVGVCPSRPRLCARRTSPVPRPR